MKDTILLQTKCQKSLANETVCCAVLCTYVSCFYIGKGGKKQDHPVYQLSAVRHRGDVVSMLCKDKTKNPLLHRDILYSPNICPEIQEI